jgi:predicted GIY-YIG superfamily endonuclease
MALSGFLLIPAEAGIHRAMSKAYFVYILASARYGTLCIGLTSHLVGRVWQHGEGTRRWFHKEIQREAVGLV